MDVRAVLFDMDGVLIDSEPFYNQRIDAFLKSIGRAPESMIDFTGSNDNAIWETLVPEDATLRDALHAQYDAYRAVHPVDCVSRGNPQAPKLFEALHARGVLTAICSSSELSMIQEYMHVQNVESLIDFAISGTQCAYHKPHPEIYLSAMEALGVQPRQCLVVEDSPIGIRAGLASGARVVALSQYSADRLDQSEAHAIVGQLHDILSFVHPQ
ncbi:MAG: HAD family phosphatase [Atopobium sp.]|uniref:HAD family hydrolase n=1 Tax=Atopobium sp. TaxID=1872650 RepID=UPI002A80DE32|nr:HAD family phosphatase [Atopobium sp.]MDY4522764.1 HAD family phosphatase [Atopobium sp.]